MRSVDVSHVVFLAHFTGSGIDNLLDMYVDDFILYLEQAQELYEKEMTMPYRVVLSGIEKR